MEELPSLETEFETGALAIGNGCLRGVAVSYVRVRAWPVLRMPCMRCDGMVPLRRTAVEHVHNLVRSLLLLPRCTQLVESATGRSPLRASDLADWLWQVSRSAEDDSSTSGRAVCMHISIRHVTDAPDWAASPDRRPSADPECPGVRRNYATHCAT